jgi:hypothetical protein
MKSLKRIVFTVVLSLVALAAVGAWLFYRAGQTGSSAVEQWVGAQLKSVAGSYLNPELNFADLDYRYPRTVVLRDFALKADDPSKPGNRVDILAADRITLELVEIPRDGEPFRIERLVLEKPAIRFIAATSGDGFIGFSNLVKQTGPQTTQPEQPTKLSELFQLRLVEVKDGLLVYDDGTSGRDRMELDQINTRMSIEPSESGWYTLKTSIQRPPVADTQIDGRLNIDDMSVDLTSLTATMSLSPENAGSLPPALQRLVKDYDVHGALAARVSGMLRLSNWQTSTLQARAELKNGHVASGEYRLPIELLTADIGVSGGAVNLQPIDITTLGGTLKIDGRVGLGDGLPSSVNAIGRDLRIEETLRVLAKDPKAEPKYSGLLSADVRFTGPLSDWKTNAGGGGETHLVQGKLERLPILFEVLNVAKKVGEAAVLGKDQSRPSDELHTVFELRGDRVRFTKIDGRASLLGLRGEGDAFFDNRLDLTVNAGPIEKLQDALGDAGKIIGVVTDKLTAYHVTGTLGEPKVSLKVAPGGKDLLNEIIK